MEESNPTKSCRYCGGNSCMVRNKPSVTEWIAKRRLDVKWPICGECWHKIKQGRMPAISTFGDNSAIEVLRECRAIADTIPNNSKIGPVLDLLGKIKDSEHAYNAACAEFSTRSLEAQQAAKKVEWIRAAID